LIPAQLLDEGFEEKQRLSKETRDPIEIELKMIRRTVSASKSIQLSLERKLLPHELLQSFLELFHPTKAFESSWALEEISENLLL